MRVIGCAVVLESFRKLVTRADQAVVLQVRCCFVPKLFALVPFT